MQVLEVQELHRLACSAVCVLGQSSMKLQRSRGVLSKRSTPQVMMATRERIRACWKSFDKEIQAITCADPLVVNGAGLMARPPIVCLSLIAVAIAGTKRCSSADNTMKTSVVHLTLDARRMNSKALLLSEMRSDCSHNGRRLMCKVRNRGPASGNEIDQLTL